METQLFFTSKMGCLNGMLRLNLPRQLNLTMTFSDIVSSQRMYDAFRTQYPEKDIKRDLLKIEECQTIITPFDLNYKLDKCAKSGNYTEQLRDFKKMPDG